MFLKPSEYLRELYSINVCLILGYLSNFSAVFKQSCFYLYLSFILCEIQALCQCLTVIGMFIFSTCFFSALQSCRSAAYVPAWLLEFVKVLKLQSLILSFLMLETEMKDNRMKRSSHNALLRLQHHRITIHITVAVAGLRKTGFEHFFYSYGVLHLVFPLIITLNY